MSDLYTKPTKLARTLDGLARDRQSRTTLRRSAMEIQLLQSEIAGKALDDNERDALARLSAAIRQAVADYRHST